MAVCRHRLTSAADARSGSPWDSEGVVDIVHRHPTP
jgi:hypothetical protein